MKISRFSDDDGVVTLRGAVKYHKEDAAQEADEVERTGGGI